MTSEDAIKKVADMIIDKMKKVIKDCDFKVFFKKYPNLLKRESEIKKSETAVNSGIIEPETCKLNMGTIRTPTIQVPNDGIDYIILYLGNEYKMSDILAQSKKIKELESDVNRNMAGIMGCKEYGRKELTAAVVGQATGFHKNIIENNIAYLKETDKQHLALNKEKKLQHRIIEIDHPISLEKLKEFLTKHNISVSDKADLEYDIERGVFLQINGNVVTGWTFGYELMTIEEERKRERVEILSDIEKNDKINIKNVSVIKVGYGYGIRAEVDGNEAPIQRLPTEDVNSYYNRETTKEQLAFKYFKNDTTSTNTLKR